jgi:hypothetical protein
MRRVSAKSEARLGRGSAPRMHPLQARCIKPFGLVPERGRQDPATEAPGARDVRDRHSRPPAWRITGGAGAGVRGQAR